MIGPERVILRGENREYFVRLGEGKLSTDMGMIDLEAAALCEEGETVLTHLGKEFAVIRPKAGDYFSHGKRTGAPMMPKDIGIVMAYTGMCARDRVLDAGTGSGIAAIYFGGCAREVVTCEVREDFSRVAGGNISDAGLSNVECRACDILEVTDGPYDIVHLDMQIEALHVEHAYSLLRKGGYFASYTPFLEQTFTVIDAAEKLFGKEHVQTVEILERELTRSARGTRPSTRVGHTGYITVARKI
ncbi:MAG TPA: methyltransferase domain-containing protein [Methanocorpusculum sp.]|nr:methyltransferase domain-containing protein [Methanocorpusculum sp.]HJJ59745.1 methyltransferase domain-containing protein [Methanocorpusculum sp.]